MPSRGALKYGASGNRINVLIVDGQPLGRFLGIANVQEVMAGSCCATMNDDSMQGEFFIRV